MKTVLAHQAISSSITSATATPKAKPNAKVCVKKVKLNANKNTSASKRFALSRLSMALLTVLGADPALATTITWVGGSGQWNVLSSWDLNRLPTFEDTVLLDSTIAIPVGTNAVAKNVVGSGTLSLSGGSSLSLNDISSSSSMSQLTLGGTLTNNGSLTVSGNTQTFGGAFAGTGSTVINGNLSFRGGANLTRVQDTHTLILNGTTSNSDFSASPFSVNYLQIDQGARVVNKGTWLDNSTNSTTISGNRDANAGGVFENQGTYTKSQNSTTEIGGYGLTFNNSGTVNIDAGSLKVSGGGTHTGVFNIASNSLLNFNNGSYLLNNSSQSVNSVGSFTIKDATVTATNGLNLGGSIQLDGATLNLEADSSFAKLNMFFANRLNNNAYLRVSGDTSINGATIAGMGTTELNGPTRIQGGANTTLIDGQTLITKGTTNAGGAFGDTPTLSIFNGAKVVNQGSWLMDGGIATNTISGDAISNRGGVFENQGTFHNFIITEIGKHGLAFNNAGVVNVNNGILTIVGGGTSTGQINVGRTIDFSTTAYHLNRNVNVSNFGLLRVSNGGTVNAHDGLSLGGRTELNNGTLNLGASSFIANLNVDSTSILNINAGVLSTNFFNAVNQGTINIASGAVLGSAFNNAGTITGNGAISAAGTFNNAGTLSPGALNSMGQLSIFSHLTQTSAGQINIDLARTAADLLAISGTATLGGTLNVNVTEELVRGRDYKVLTWTDRTANSAFDAIRFAQAANYRLGTTYDVDGLTISMKGFNFYWSGPENGGLWNADPNWTGGNGGRPQAGDAAFLGKANTRLNNIQQIAEIIGSGTLTLARYGDLRLSERAHLGGLVLEDQSNFQNNGLAVVSGASYWQGGTVTGSGTTRFEGDTTLAESPHALINGHRMEFAGNTTHTGGIIYTGQGSRLINLGTWTEQNTGYNLLVNGYGGASSTFENIGTFNKNSNSAFIVTGGVTFNNTGTLNVNAGMLDIQAGLNSTTGQINIASAGALRLSSGPANIKGTIINHGILKIEGRGVLNPVESLVIQGGQTILNDSTINNNDVLRITGAFDWKQGTLTGVGTTRLEGNTTLSESTHAIMNGHTIEFVGNTSHTGGIIYTGQGSRLINLGTWTDQNTGNNSLSNGYGGASSTFENTGTFNKASNTEFVIGGGTVFNNTGTLNVNAGTLQFSGETNNAIGHINIASTAVLKFNSGNANLKGAINNAGSLKIEGRGTFNTSGDLVVQGGQTVLNDSIINNHHVLRLAGDFYWSQGTITGAGTTRFEGNTTLAESTHAVMNGHTIQFAGNTTHTGGTIYTGSGAQLVNLGNWVDQTTSNVDISNGYGGTISRFDNQGTLTKTTSSMTTFGDGLTLNNTGNIQVNAGTLRLLSGFNNQGHLNVANGAELSGQAPVFSNAGILTGDGTIRANFHLTNTGTLAAGGIQEAGQLSLIGNLVQSTTGQFLVDLGGTQAGEFDLFSISGNALLGGTLAINLLDGVNFKVGDSFTVMTWNQRLNNSQFANLDFTQANGYLFNAEYNNNNLTLRVVTVPVPEPSSTMLLGLGLLGLVGWRRLPLMTT